MEPETAPLPNMAGLNCDSAKLVLVRAALDGVSDAVWILDAERRQVAWANGAARALSGEADSGPAPPPGGALAPFDPCTALGTLPSDVAIGDQTHRIEVRLPSRDGTLRTVPATARRLTVAGGRWMILTLAAGAARAEDLPDRGPAACDPLTRLPDRNAFRDALAAAHHAAQASTGNAFALLFIDLDGFKRVNDRRGHLAGDAALVEIARRLRHAIRPGDLAARVGGDEFCVLLAGLREAADATQVAARIVARIAPPICVEGDEFCIAASIGVALSAAGYDSPEQMLAAADRAMYAAKRRGGAGHCLADESGRAAPM